MMLCQQTRCRSPRLQLRANQRRCVRLSCDPGPPNRGSCTATGAERAVRRCSATSSCVAANAVQAMTEDKGNPMTIPPDLEAQILRYHHVEKWRAGTIARQLRVHYDTVVRVLSQAGLPTWRLMR